VTPATVPSAATGSLCDLPSHPPVDLAWPKNHRTFARDAVDHRNTGEPRKLRSRLHADSRGEDGHLMRIEQRVTVFDAAELAPESRFWAGLLNGTVRDLGRVHLVLVNDVPVVGVQLAPDHVPPDWPDGTPQQIHTDLVVSDPDQAHAEVLALGARVLGRRPDVDPAAGFQVYADPAGHPFCLCWDPTTTSGMSTTTPPARAATPTSPPPATQVGT